MNREMGKRKLEQTKEKFENISETGDEVVSKAEQVDAIFDTTDFEGLDSEDIAAKDSAIDGYKTDFDSALDEQIINPTNEVKGEAGSNVEQLLDYKNRVDEAREKFEQAAGVSEIGSQNSEQAGSQMEISSMEYEQIIEQNNSAIEKAEQSVQEKRNLLGGLF